MLETNYTSAGGEVAYKNAVSFHSEPQNLGHLSSFVHCPYRERESVAAVKSFQVTQGKPIAVCTLLAEEFGNFCPGSRGSQSLEHSFFLGTERSLVFLVVLGVTASPVSGTVSCLHDAIALASCGESPCPQCKFCFHTHPRRLWSPHPGVFFSHTNYFFLMKR